MNVSDPKCRDVASLRELWDCLFGKRDEAEERFVQVNGRKFVLGSPEEFYSFLLRNGAVAFDCDGLVTGNIKYLKEGRMAVKNGTVCTLVKDMRMTAHKMGAASDAPTSSSSSSSSSSSPSS